MYKRINRKKQVLLIDDEENLLQVLGMLLETRGYDVKVANSGKQALKKASPDIDLVILDLVLPDINGFEICRRLKRKHSTQDIPIIILSASSYCEDKVEGLYLGADDYLAKPCDHEELFARMEAVMRRVDLHKKYEECKRRDDIVLELRKILDQALIVPHFQPIYKLDTMEMYGLEILTRPTTESVLANPDVFFKAALQYGMYTDMEILSWTMALTAISECIKNEKIFLNCNPYLIESLQFDRMKEIFSKSKINPNHVIMEITERSAITDFKLFYDKLAQYRGAGFKFAVDDVGGGYASLESIVETKPEVVKIDRHIIRGITSDGFKESIVRFIVSLCQDNDIIAIAEGIETIDDLNAVKKLGVAAAQGYYFYKPTPIVDFESFYKVNG